MTDPTKLPKRDLLDALVEAYDLPGDPEDIMTFPHYDYVFCLTVGGRRYIAKVGNDWSEADIQFKIGLQDYLHEVGYPIAPVLRTKTDDGLWNSGGIGSILMPYIGAPYDPKNRREQCDATATALGWFHRDGQKAQGLGSCYWDDDAKFDYSQAFNQNAYEFLAGKSLSPSNREFVTACIDEMGSMLKTAKGLLLQRDWWQLPHVPVHGEFCQYHCRFEDGRLVAVIDWDTTRLAPRIQDLARAVDVGLGWGESVETYDSYQWRWTDTPTVEAVAQWMNGYLAMAPPLTTKEVELFPYVCAAICYLLPADLKCRGWTNKCPTANASCNSCDSG